MEVFRNEETYSYGVFDYKGAFLQNTDYERVIRSLSQFQCLYLIQDEFKVLCARELKTQDISEIEFYVLMAQKL